MKENGKTKICFIDHSTHNAVIETIDNEVLNSKYDGEEENFIKDVYGYTDEDLKEIVSWDWIEDVYIITPNEPKS